LTLTIILTVISTLVSIALINYIRYRVALSKLEAEELLYFGIREAKDTDLCTDGHEWFTGEIALADSLETIKNYKDVKELEDFVSGLERTQRIICLKCGLISGTSDILGTEIVKKLKYQKQRREFTKKYDDAVKSIEHSLIENFTLQASKDGLDYDKVKKFAEEIKTVGDKVVSDMKKEQILKMFPALKEGPLND
jgi:hypothetical protein